MIYLFNGPNTYTRAQAVVELKHELDQDGMLSTNTALFDGAHLDVAALIATCDTVPFLANCRLVIVTDLLAQAQSRQPRVRAARGRRPEEGASAGYRELIDYAPRMPVTTNLLLLDGVVSPDNSLLGVLKPLASIRSFPQLGDQELITWITARVAEAGASIEPRAAITLARAARGDLWMLASEVEKLGLYAQGRTIAEADVRRLVAASQESNVFAMVDAVVAGRLEAALLQLRLLRDDGAAGPYLITMIARQYRQLIIAQDLISAGASAATVGQAAEIRSDSALRRTIEQARRLQPEQLLLAYERILDADLAIKRGEADEDVALEMLIADLTRSKAHDGW